MPRRLHAELWLELESRCNLRCPFCFNHWKDGQSHAPDPLAVGELLQCLEDLLTYVDCTAVALSGGEPLLNPNLDVIVAFFAHRRVPTVLTTNGTRLTESRLAALRGAGLVGVQVPLLSAQAAIHDELSGARCWHKSVAALATARAASPDVAAVFVATRRNLDQLPGVLEVLAWLGIPRVIFNRFIPSGAGAVNERALSVGDEHIWSVLCEGNDLAGALGSSIELGVPISEHFPVHTLRHVRPTACDRATRTPKLTVDAAGQLKLCNQTARVVGNLTSPSTRRSLSRTLQDGSWTELPGADGCFCMQFAARATNPRSLLRRRVANPPE